MLTRRLSLKLNLRKTIDSIISSGVYISSREYKNWCDEVFITVPNGMQQLIVIRLIELVLIAIVLLLTGIGMIFLSFFICGAPSVYYLPTAAYLLLYWIIPFMISGMLGMYLGITIHTKLIYFLTFIISLLLGSIIPLMVVAFTLSGRGSLYEIYILFSVGQLDPNEPVSESFGYTLNGDLWLMRGMVLLAEFFLLLSVICKYNGKSLKKCLLVILAVIMWASSIWGNNRILHGLNQNYHYEKLAETYKEENMSIVNDDIPYEIKAYDILLDDGRKLNFETELSMDVKNDCDKMSFSLFHAFETEKILADGVKIQFEQRTDELILENTFCKGRAQAFIQIFGIAACEFVQG